MDEIARDGLLAGEVRPRTVVSKDGSLIILRGVNLNPGAVTQEELNGRMSEQMEKRMYLLAMVAAVFLPLTFITGLLGINVAGIPGAENRWAFLGVTFVLVVIILGQLWFFRKRRWI